MGRLGQVSGAPVPRIWASGMALVPVALLLACGGGGGPGPGGTLIRGALLIDGTGAAARPADVRIENGRIQDIGSLENDVIVV